MSRTYSELITIDSFVDRFRYLKLGGRISEETFGHRRYINQQFYKSDAWLSLRNQVIIRDNGQDLGMEGFDIIGPIIIHHINPVSFDDILNQSRKIFDLENVICTKLSTHNAIHYGDESKLLVPLPERKRGDTILW